MTLIPRSRASWNLICFSSTNCSPGDEFFPPPALIALIPVIAPCNVSTFFSSPRGRMNLTRRAFKITIGIDGNVRVRVCGAGPNIQVVNQHESEVESFLVYWRNTSVLSEGELETFLLDEEREREGANGRPAAAGSWRTKRRATLTDRSEKGAHRLFADRLAVCTEGTEIAEWTQEKGLDVISLSHCTRGAKNTRRPSRP